jgi:hypothetical protein
VAQIRDRKKRTGAALDLEAEEKNALANPKRDLLPVHPKAENKLTHAYTESCV